MSSNTGTAYGTAPTFWKRTPTFVPSTIGIVYSGESSSPSETIAKAPPAEPTLAPLAMRSEEPPKPIPPSTDEVPPEPLTSTGSSSFDETSSIEHAKDMAPTDPLELKFHALLTSANVDIEELRKQSWKGIPSSQRSTAWCLLMGYFPLNASRRSQTISRKRREYMDWVRQTFSRGEDALDRTLWHQIRIDVPRTTPGSPLFQSPRIQRSLERVLYCWAVRHPASGYVQGINDLLTPFYFVFLSPHLAQQQVDSLDDSAMDTVEADSFWCLTKLLDGIQDNYTHAQPGIQRQLIKMKDLVSRIDAPLAAHLDSEGVEFIQFAFRWINCLLMREVSLASTIRMWDTYLAEPDGFSTFHIYVCAAFLLKWSKQIQQLDFQKTLLLLQRPPTEPWTAKDVELLLSEAYMYKCLYHNSPNHYSATQKR
ncbi:GTPase-activating protein [Coemansia sp. RSA 2050]|nr:GTPase-activating protein [Coemansia sp. RSA 2050]KAJ2734379.1 GTPase-activating protein [Coemansia sp. BCRC 34962]